MIDEDLRGIVTDRGTSENKTVVFKVKYQNNRLTERLQIQVFE